jgi:hypothetical protein
LEWPYLQRMERGDSANQERWSRKTYHPDLHWKC